jgi:hypothetical protein
MGPSPPFGLVPVSALKTALTGEDPVTPEVEPLEDEVPLPPTRDPLPCRTGAVALASAAAARPSAPLRVSARRVAAETAPPPPPELPAEPRDVAALPDVPPPPPECTELVGRPPPAVGMTSTYWPIPEFPGGATARAIATGGTAAVIRNARARPRAFIFVNIRLTGV